MSTRASHVHEQFPLLTGVIQRHVGVGALLGEPAPGQILLAAAAVFKPAQGHGVAADVQGILVKRAPPGEAHQVPVHPHEIPGRGPGDEHGPPRQGLHPVRIGVHGRLGGHQVLAALGPGLGELRPPLHHARVGRGAFERLQVHGETAQFLPVGVIGHGGQAQHGMGSRDGTVGLDVGGDVDLGLGFGFGHNRPDLTQRHADAKARRAHASDKLLYINVIRH
jgi:hypothetical protein